MLFFAVCLLLSSTFIRSDEKSYFEPFSTKDLTNHTDSVDMMLSFRDPTSYPTAYPTTFPTTYPTAYPTVVPSTFPTSIPSSNPTTIPTSSPTQHALQSNYYCNSSQLCDAQSDDYCKFYVENVILQVSGNFDTERYVVRDKPFILLSKCNNSTTPCVISTGTFIVNSKTQLTIIGGCELKVDATNKIYLASNATVKVVIAFF